jgi:hypothetical protein
MPQRQLPVHDRHQPGVCGALIERDTGGTGCAARESPPKQARRAGDFQALYALLKTAAQGVSAHSPEMT